MDWSNIISELQNAGYSQKQIAEHCGCSQGLISQIKTRRYSRENGKQSTVSYSMGVALLSLYENINRPTPGSTE